MHYLEHFSMVAVVLRLATAESTGMKGCVLCPKLRHSKNGGISDYVGCAVNGKTSRNSNGKGCKRLKYCTFLYIDSIDGKLDGATEECGNSGVWEIRH